MNLLSSKLNRESRQITKSDSNSSFFCSEINCIEIEFRVQNSRRFILIAFGWHCTSEERAAKRFPVECFRKLSSVEDKFSLKLQRHILLACLQCETEFNAEWTIPQRSNRLMCVLTFVWWWVLFYRRRLSCKVVAAIIEIRAGSSKCNKLW